MKKQITISLTVLSFLIAGVISCTKSKDIKSLISNSNLRVGNVEYDILSGANSDILAVADKINSSGTILSINENPNFGILDPNDLLGSINMGGVTQENVSIKINGQSYQPISQGGWHQSSLTLKDHYGKNLNIETISNSGINTYTFYSPQVLKVSKLGIANSILINRTGNQLSWNLDDQNPYKNIVISYQCFGDDMVGERFNPISTGNIIVSDNGSYNIDNLITNSSIKRIYLKFGRGNGEKISFKGSEASTFLNVKSIDHHEYIIQ